MPRSKKLDAPDFDPVVVDGFRPDVRSLAVSEIDCERIASEDITRMSAELATASIRRLQVLQEFLGVPGKLGENLFPLLIAVANKYVPGFEVTVATPAAKPGPRKSAERFKIVTMVEARAAAEGIALKTAIRDLAAKKINGRTLSVDSLTTKYFGALREIKGHPQGAALLRLWRMGLPNDSSADLDVLFWSFENQHLKAVKAHNVHQFPLKK